MTEEYSANRCNVRIGWLDNAKALGIFLVVFGHAYDHASFCKTLIYCFHMPLFFFLSGYLLKQRYLDGKFRNFIKRAFRTLIIPYISFWTISFGFRIATDSLRSQLVHTEKQSYMDQIYGFIFGIRDTLSTINGVLWFLTCLFCTMMIFYWLSKIQNTKFLLSLLALLGLIGPMIHNYIAWRLPWNMELSLVTVFFLGIGYIASKPFTSMVVKRAANRGLALALLLVILIIVAKMNGQVNVARMQFKNLLLFYIGAFSGIGVTIILSQMIRDNACFEWLSRNTLVIFSTHLMIFTIFKGLSMKYLNINPDGANLSIGLVYTMGALGVCYPISYIIDRYFPWMTGHRVLLACKRNPLYLKVSKPFF